jgi:hypothetical protein
MKTAWWSANPFNPDPDALVLSRARFFLRGLECPGDQKAVVGTQVHPVLIPASRSPYKPLGLPPGASIWGGGMVIATSRYCVDNWGS